MDLPRFTSGNLGRLTFKDVNALCDVAERANEFLRTVEQQEKGESGRKDIWAVLLGYAIAPAVAGAINFQEVELIRYTGTPPHWVPRWMAKSVGIKSGEMTINGQVNFNYIPCFFIQANAIQQNYRFGIPFGVARLRWHQAENGLGCWFVVAQEQRTMTFPARINNYTPILGGAYPRWSYQWSEVRRAQNPPTATTMEDFPEQFVSDGAAAGSSSVNIGAAVNGAEFTLTAPTVPASVSLTRQPIGLGDVVQMSVDDSGKPFFCKANAYAVACI